MAGTSLVHLTSMPYTKHHNSSVIILNVTDDTISSNAETPKATHVTPQHLRAAQLSWVRGLRDTAGQFLLNALRCLPV